MSVDLKALAQQLTETAEKQGFRIILEPISTHAETPLEASQKPSDGIAQTPVKNPIPNSKADSETAKAIAKERNSWLTVAQAARMMGIADKTIRNWIRAGKVESKKESVLMVSTDVLNLEKGSQANAAKPVYCIETKTRFASESQAARAIGSHPICIKRAAENAKPVKGLHFCRCDTAV